MSWSRPSQSFQVYRRNHRDEYIENLIGTIEVRTFATTRIVSRSTWAIVRASCDKLPSQVDRRALPFLHDGSPWSYWTPQMFWDDGDDRGAPESGWQVMPALQNYSLNSRKMAITPTGLNVLRLNLDCKVFETLCTYSIDIWIILNRFIV